MKILSILTALLGAAAVICGAFGAHALKSVLDSDTMEIYNKAVSYQFIHVLASFGAIALYRTNPKKMLQHTVLMFMIGIVLFSGSLYMIAGFKHSGTNIPLPIALSTPLGGLCFITGWLMLTFYFVRYKFS